MNMLPIIMALNNTTHLLTQQQMAMNRNHPVSSQSKKEEDKEYKPKHAEEEKEYKPKHAKKEEEYLSI